MCKILESYGGEADMEKEKLERIRNLLLERQREILGKVGASSEDLGQLQNDHTADWIDRVTVDNAVNNLLNMESELANELMAIRRSLRKIKEGTYGICENCGKEIGYERLEALPTALYCRNCQDEIEKSKGSNSGYRGFTSIPKEIFEWYE
ncbi:RNA polymerase-binding protein DksA [candidate division KSB1 bacterium]|nr:MAG: hypothetical protein B5M50_01665 [candidate division KSB1 bacterium 4484_219]RKY80617.1 MAG: RNA polymerase-binding protein DksA [candidate division KSB1 bacterium]HDI52186.1 TraR/DksA family transcriptional regulator [Bacteroidota bacterium]RKY83364.1 MAG: RNA polymerase-binding protein DksA [candidate division KSB1 bacterium]RKY88313.1 MAG: RNA polymerase-binding protein DksA [candidate division KSB1 bacterium]